MNGNRRRAAAVALVLVVGAGVVWTLASLNATDSPVPPVGPVETGAFGGPTVGVGALAGGVVLLAVAVALWRRVARDAGRAPPSTPRRR